MDINKIAERINKSGTSSDYLVRSKSLHLRNNSRLSGDDMIHVNTATALDVLRLTDATAFLSLYAPRPTMCLDKLGRNTKLR